MCFPLCGAAAAIGMDIATGVAAIEERLEHRRVGYGGDGDDYFAQLLVAEV